MIFIALAPRLIQSISCNVHNKNRSLKRLWNMTNIQTWISQLVEVEITLSHFPVKDCGLVFHPWKFGCPILPALGAVAPKSLLGREDQLFRNLTIILYPLETFWMLISRFGTKWTCIIGKSLLKPRKHLNISATLYLVDSALCIA